MSIAIQALIAIVQATPTPTISPSSASTASPPDFISLLNACGVFVTAIATAALAAFAALQIQALRRQVNANQEQVEANKQQVDLIREQIQQATEAQYDQQLPILIPLNALFSFVEPHPGSTRDAPGFDYDARYQHVSVINQGPGIAFDIYMLACSASAAEAPGTLQGFSGYHYLPIPTAGLTTVLNMFHKVNVPTDATIADGVFLRPPDEPNVAVRLTITLHDLFKRKHALIYDLYIARTGNTAWRFVTMTKVSQDLKEMGLAARTYDIP